jgi:uncharacterized membrane protein
MYQNVIRRILFITLPIVVYCTFLFVLWFTYAQEYGSSQYWKVVGLFVIYFVPPLGKESVIPGAIGLGYPPWIICFGVILMDILSCAFISLNFDLLEKVPFVRDLIHKFMNNADKMRKKNPWVEKLSYLGLLIFMYIPLQGSGASTTTILGKLFGVKTWMTFSIVTIGSILSTLSIEVGMQLLIDLWGVNSWHAILAAIIFVIVVVIFYWKLKKKNEL